MLHPDLPACGRPQQRQRLVDPARSDQLSRCLPVELAGTDLCEAPHFQYHVTGTLHIVMADGAEYDARPGDVTALPQGHDAWVVGAEPVVVVDWYGASNYART